MGVTRARQAAQEDLSHPLFARLYERVAARAEERGQREHRRELVAGLSGRIVEVGAGIGLNLAHYPPTVTELVAIEPEPRLRARLRQAVRSAQVPVTVMGGLAERLPLEDGSMDAAIASLVLCSVRDPDRALAELRRVLRPGGELRFYEHVRSSDARFARMQDLAALVYPKFVGGCHPNRQTVRAIEDAGFQIAKLRRFMFKPAALAIPNAPHVLGTAFAPEPTAVDSATATGD